MANCINVNSVQYRELKRLSTLPEILLKAEIARYQENHEGRFPTVDEIPGASSIEAMKQDWEDIKEPITTPLTTIGNVIKKVRGEEIAPKPDKSKTIKYLHEKIAKRKIRESK
jgi:hypothetical protein